MKLTRVLVLLGLLTSCNLLEKSSQRSDAVARVGTYYLYQSDLSGLVPEGSDPDDSLEITKSYIDNWIRRHLILMEAESQLTAEQKDVSAKLEEYRQSLLQYRIENEVIAPLMDTVVDSDLILTYFKANKEQLALRRPLMRGRFVKIDRDAPRQDYLRQLLGSKGTRNAKELEDYCFQYASQFQVADTNWLYVDEVMRGTPTEIMQDFAYGQRGSVQQRSDSTHVYLLLLRDYKGVGEAPPLSVEAQNIRSLILLQRRQEFIERYYQDLYKRSLAEKTYEIYTP